jgi:sporulation protein YlmC with PRC-barrel domain
VVSRVPVSGVDGRVRRTIKTRDRMPSGMDGTPQEITSIIGREVYSNNGVFVGEVEDVRLNLDRQSVTGLALSELNAELFRSRIEPGKGVLIPYRWVRAVGDVILINDVIERLEDEDAENDEILA